MQVNRVLARNPGPMTLEGTNTLVVRNPDHHGVLVIDPGPLDVLHLERLTRLGRVELILLTHHHGDHTQSAHRLAAMSSAPIRAADERLCLRAGPLVDGEEIVAGGVRLNVIETAGHTADSLCFYLPDDRPIDVPRKTGSMITGDTILGRGTPVISEGASALRDYLSSLHRLADYGDAVVIPGHGPRLDNLRAVSELYLNHRLGRLRDVERVAKELRDAGDLVTASNVASRVYAHVDEETKWAAEASAATQLAFLAAETSEPERGTSASSAVHRFDEGFARREGPGR
ncbi:putative polyketide biosynthesis zinc-dependent hydrolase BaeB [Microbacterium trichothecenolyticum]|uniref:Putative polyketide biosynthesis zinc-dependent hydrolase BaeB n=2 Tax=Microbacterium trichothecenolyticum TaxID=69370 RepID=A0A0M2HC80_MICTR|nr:putative polyketide biosynthesis zinc-dependent hydrolase BaeB [Microbacterium trichothecenolyticum]